jgi:hypothetical protein
MLTLAVCSKAFVNYLHRFLYIVNQLETIDLNKIVLTDNDYIAGIPF